ncbi:hypothetical protein Daus18300_012742 [Diaporthe australafricana]|uniref:Uncharacterized protein n=1 Tax=Diaporthe australafricana TaxID=127596 RepID=A0ABR3W1J8_9PEZI
MSYGPPYPQVPVKWEDIMVAISEYPRFFGEPAKVSHTTEWPKIDSYVNASGSVPLRITQEFTDNIHIDTSDVEHLTDEMRWAGVTLQNQDLPDLYGLTFRILPNSQCHQGGGPDTKDCITPLLQTIKGSPLAIENARLELSHFITHLPGRDSDADSHGIVLANGPGTHGAVFTNGPGTQVKHQLWTGEPDLNPWSEPEKGKKGKKPSNKDKKPSKEQEICTEFEARDSAALRAMKQPDWEPLFPADYNLVYTVQDGQLYLAWAITFRLKYILGDNFNVWVNARDCKHIISASSASIATSVRTRDEFVQQQIRLFQDRGINASQNNTGDLVF